MTKKEEKNLRMLECDFIFGSDVWKIAYASIFYTMHVRFNNAIKEGDMDIMQAIQSVNFMKAYNDANRSKLGMSNFKLNEPQLFIMLKFMDELAEIILSGEQDSFMKEFVKGLNMQMPLYADVKEFEDFFIKHATTFIDVFKKNAKETMGGKIMMKSLKWE